MSLSLPDDITIRDVQQWLEGCYVYVGDQVAMYRGGPSPARGDSEDGTAVSAVVQYSNGSDSRVSVRDIRCFWPVCGAINRRVYMKPSKQSPVLYAMYVERRQRKQYRRSFTTSCVHTTIPSAWGLSKVIGQTDLSGYRKIWFDSAEELFSPTYYTPTQALQMIRDGAFSVAVSPQLIICGDGKGQHSIYYRTMQVGGYSDGIFTPTVEGYPADRARHMLREVLTNAY